MQKLFATLVGLAVLLSVLERRAALRTGDLDIFLNVVGGLRLNEPAADLAVVAALVSSVRDIPVDPQTAFIGEVGLGGEVRAVSHLERRLAECSRLKFQRAFMSRASKPPAESSIVTTRVGDIGRLLDELFS